MNEKYIKNQNLGEKITRCVIYTRKSCEEGLELEYNSLDNQYDICKKYVESQQHLGLALVTDNIGNPKRYDDGGFSGGNIERPALRELLKDIQSNKIDLVVVYKIDRLSRSLSDFLKLIELFNKNNVSFISITQNINTNDATGKLMLNVLMSFAQFEREMTSDRIRDKIRMQKSRGMWTGGAIPFGYDNKDKKLIVNEEEAKNVRFIFNTFIDTQSIQETINVLKQNNVRTKTHKHRNEKETGGTDFDRGSLYRILKNKTYIGIIENKGTKDIYKGQHEPIIDETTFNKVQEIFKQNINEAMFSEKKSTIVNDHHTGNTLKLSKVIHSPKPNSKIPYLLRGIMKCSCCNSILTPTYTTKKNGVVYRYYKPNKLIKHTINAETRKCLKINLTTHGIF
jgi:DNA invertase Pin-like site-specific DNA recombinase